MKIRTAAPFVVFCFLVVFLTIGLSLDPGKVPSPFIGKPAPEFRLPVLQSGDIVSLQDFKGKTWLLNVWASWCAACRDEHPLLNTLSRENIVDIVGLNYKDEGPDAVNWLAELGNPYTEVLVDRTGDTAIDYGVYGVPETFLIDSLGMIRYKHIGPLTPAVLEREILPRIQILQGRDN